MLVKFIGRGSLLRCAVILEKNSEITKIVRAIDRDEGVSF